MWDSHTRDSSQMTTRRNIYDHQTWLAVAPKTSRFGEGAKSYVVDTRRFFPVVCVAISKFSPRVVCELALLGISRRVYGRVGIRAGQVASPGNCSLVPLSARVHIVSIYNNR